ncbi:putative haloacid dehalogenase-like hydrolase [Leptomonas pyrrhocoris]|uniref:Putative haloacid dehalogenase-like hydrolase n=1 Tax=Leptomonas pyrrhocoris TaxID=157538 RepID=A0A0M9G9B8_LEPPY|nr:putative haloacid dehalogenase-like hydrolase [Leptomonas pyrrhocoris]KPA85367.1 putative haloacid dehalogenase-like hydrolase [Leptomonas pyrrhocoris]|eukprot:XP_015663806.1 putative haloacid dehalogenase-like hydrolase [Leptomonas pyrrhocoris]
MDGTFLSPHHTVSKRTRDVVEFMQKEQGIPFLFATGRHHVDVLATVRKIHLEGYVLTSNGARAHDPAGKVVMRQDMDPALARELACFAVDNKDITTSIYQEDAWRMNRDTEDMKEYYEDNKDVFFPVMFDPPTHESYAGVYKVYYTSDRHETAKLGELEMKLKETFGSRVYIAYSVPRCMEVMPAGVNKASGLSLLLKQYIFPSDPRSGAELLKACIAFGDGENDAPMLMAAGHGCVMSNAQTRLLDLIPLGADPHLEKIGSNAEDAVAQKLIEVFHLDM